MILSQEHARSVVDVYIRAWVTQDPDLILTVFTEDATYHERPLEAPIRDHSGIRRYWQEKVIQSQSRIECRLLNLYVDGTTAIAEWEASFDDVAQGVRKRMREVAILDFRGPRIQSLREYWTSEEVEALGTD